MHTERFKSIPVSSCTEFRLDTLITILGDLWWEEVKAGPSRGSHLVLRNSILNETRVLAPSNGGKVNVIDKYDLSNNSKKFGFTLMDLERKPAKEIRRILYLERCASAFPERKVTLDSLIVDLRTSLDPANLNLFLRTKFRSLKSEDENAAENFAKWLLKTNPPTHMGQRLQLATTFNSVTGQSDPKLYSLFSVSQQNINDYVELLKLRDGSILHDFHHARINLDEAIKVARNKGSQAVENTVKIAVDNKTAREPISLIKITTNQEPVSLVKITTQPEASINASASAPITQVPAPSSSPIPALAPTPQSPLPTDEEEDEAEEGTVSNFAMAPIQGMELSMVHGMLKNAIASKATPLEALIAVSHDRDISFYQMRVIARDIGIVSTSKRGSKTTAAERAEVLAACGDEFTDPKGPGLTYESYNYFVAKTALRHSTWPTSVTRQLEKHGYARPPRSGTARCVPSKTIFNALIEKTKQRPDAAALPTLPRDEIKTKIAPATVVTATAKKRVASEHIAKVVTGQEVSVAKLAFNKPGSDYTDAEIMALPLFKALKISDEIPDADVLALSRSNLDALFKIERGKQIKKMVMDIFALPEYKKQNKLILHSDGRVEV